MIRKKIIFTIFSLSVVLLIASCHPLSQEIDKATLQCIPPEETFAFPVGVPASNLLVTPVPPSLGLATIPLPENFTSSNIVYYKDSLWLLARSLEAKENLYILRLNILSSKWKIYDEINGNQFNQNYSLIVTPTHQLFGLATVQYTKNKSSRLFVQYNEKMDKFDYIQYEGEDFFVQQQKIQDEISNYQITGYAFDKNNNLWFTDRHNLYQFNIENSQIDLVIQSSSNSTFSEIQIDSNNIVWFLDTAKGNLLKYNSVTKEINTITSMFSDGFSAEDFLRSNTFLDSKQRLWISDKGWFALNEQDFQGNPLWYRVIRSPVFIGYPNRPENTFEWQHPSILTETSDGTIWFQNSFFGLIKLQPENGEWCKITTNGYGAITEDSQNNVWILFQSKLYKLPLGEQ